MDNISSNWEAGFTAGVESQSALLADARLRIAELERADFVPRCDLDAAKNEIAMMKQQRSTQAATIIRLLEENVALKKGI